MKLSISRAPARAAVLAAITARTFVTMTVDAPPTHNGAYLCPLIAAALALPWLLCVRALNRRLDARAVTALSAALLPLVLLDAAVTAGEITGSAGYLALDRVPERLLLLPVCAAALWCVFRHGNTVGYAAMLWARLFPLLLILIVALQAQCLRPEWLRPLLGSGWHAIWEGGVRLAGRILPCSALLLIAEGREDAPERRGTTTSTLLTGALVSALLILLHRMMVPTPIREAGWLKRLDDLLTNGRAPLYLQLPMICAWYAGLLHLLACECFAGATLLQRLLPRLGGRQCALLSVAAVALAAAFLPVIDIAEMLSPWQYIAVAPLTALITFVAAGRKGGAASCA